MDLYTFVIYVVGLLVVALGIWRVTDIKPKTRAKIALGRIFSFEIEKNEEKRA